MVPSFKIMPGHFTRASQFYSFFPKGQPPSQPEIVCQLNYLFVSNRRHSGRNKGTGKFGFHCYLSIDMGGTFKETDR